MTAPIAGTGGSGAGSVIAKESTFHKIFRICGASTGLIIISLGLGLALAASLGGLVWLIATAMHHAASG
jgi:hypothetical protein